MKKSTLFRNCRVHNFKKNRLIITPDKKPIGIYQITSGFVVVYSSPLAGKRKIQAFLKSGDFFPLVWTILAVQKKLYFAALTDCATCFVTKNEFLYELKVNKNAAQDVINIFATYLSMYIDRVDNLGYETLQKRLISRLLFFTTRFGKKEGKGISINLPLTHSLIAESIGVSRENVTRELKILKDNKLVLFKNHHLVLLNPKKLKKMLGLGKSV